MEDIGCNGREGQSDPVNGVTRRVNWPMVGSRRAWRSISKVETESLPWNCSV